MFPPSFCLLPSPVLWLKASWIILVSHITFHLSHLRILGQQSQDRHCSPSQKRAILSVIGRLYPGASNCLIITRFLLLSYDKDKISWQTTPEPEVWGWLTRLYLHQSCFINMKLLPAASVVLFFLLKSHISTPKMGSESMNLFICFSSQDCHSQ